MRTQISNEQIDMVAKKIELLKWKDLMQTLGFLEHDIEHSMHERDKVVLKVITDLLKNWRDQDPKQATRFCLRRYLEECGMIDAAIVLD